MLIPKRKTVGIFGGSFDPPHKGHVEISKISLRKLKLNRIYWIVAKKNPFKKKPFFSLKERILKSKKYLYLMLSLMDNFYSQNIIKVYKLHPKPNCSSHSIFLYFHIYFVVKVIDIIT